MTRTSTLRIATLLALAITQDLHAQLLPEPTPERCVAGTGSTTASQWLDRAARAVLPADTVDRVLAWRGSHDTPLWEQSDRMYAPHIPNATLTERWFDWRTGVEGRGSIERRTTPGQRPAQLYDYTGIYGSRDSTVVAFPAAFANNLRYGGFNPWLVLREWRHHAADARVAQRCLYRDAWRVVLERDGERLFLSESDAVPVKLERTESHYLWGQVKAEYLWSTWWGVTGGGAYPNAAFRFFDGTLYDRAGVFQFQVRLIPRDSAPRLDVAGAQPAPSATAFDMPDTIRVSDNTWLLQTRAYTHAVTLRRDTVFLFDATTSEARSRGDSTWIARLFPGRHPIVLVVTDLAWPHISGVRFWVARGATVVSHRASESFLRRVVDRRWTLNPDALESTRQAAPFRFRAVDDSLRLAGGDIVVHALRNTSTETAVGAWIAPDRFFWAGDYVQGGGTSPYARDVVSTIRQLGLVPLTVGAQHASVTPWPALDARYPARQP